MNITVFLGVTSFVLWSAFSTWYYVNYIRWFDPAQQKELVMVPVNEKAKVDESVAGKETPVVVAEQTPSPVKLSRSFSFHKNTARLIHPGAIKHFIDSLQTVLTDRSVSVSITGHGCDLGDEAHNFNLGMNRAHHMETALNTSNIGWFQIITDSKGESDPLVPNTSEINRIKNRRVTILITTKP